MSEKRDTSHKEARAALRKILAGKGRLQGNFYCACNTKGTEIALVVTLTARDPKGAKAAALGKELRKEINGAKFIRGVVIADGSKLLFTPHSGTGTKDHMKLGFKKTLANEKGLNFIKKALFKAKGADEPDAPDVDDEGQELESDIDLAELFDDETMTPLQRASETAAMEILVKQQNRISDLNEQLQDFLSDEDAEKELGEEIALRLDRITNLSDTGDNAEAIEQERRSLAQSLYNGTEPFPEPGQEVSPEIKQVLALSLDKATKSLQVYLDGAAEKIRQMHSDVSAMDASERVEHAPQLLKDLSEYRKAVISYNEQLQQTVASK